MTQGDVQYPNANEPPGTLAPARACLPVRVGLCPMSSDGMIWNLEVGKPTTRQVEG